MTSQFLVRTGILAAALLLAPTLAYAQATDIGKREYLNSCAVCHGTTGKGDGLLARELTKAPSDLTHLDKVSIFPLLYSIIDGRRTVASHGPREMPVWGDRYTQQASELTSGLGTPAELESFTRGRILALIGYISTLQEK
jgi:mono/diheme cytochrome c family protein